MTREQLFKKIQEKKSFLCVGLDTDISKLPPHLLDSEDPLFEFNRQIIDATKSVAVAYKPNLAFYESLGTKGWQSLEKTLAYIPNDIFTIADAKRGDIGNTSRMYAKAFFEHLGFDAVTVAPYMGEDSVTPFLGYTGKWVILLALTSNKGADDFQTLPLATGKSLYEQVLHNSLSWGNADNMMYVVGATRAAMLREVRKIIPDHFLLIPGVGAQGGSLEEVAKCGMNSRCGLLVNSSRNILYASAEKDFARRAGEEATAMQKQMEQLLSVYL